MIIKLCEKKLEKIDSYHQHFFSNTYFKNLSHRVRRYKTKEKPSIAQHILEMAKPIAEKSILGRLAHLGASKILGTLQAHSLKNFTS